MGLALGLVTIVVRDYAEAKAFYLEKLGFSLIEDTDLGGGKRWLVVSPGNSGARLLLAKAKNEKEFAAIGEQTGGRVGFFIESGDFERDYAAMLAQGVKFRETPRRESYGVVAVFEDLYGNLFDLIEMKTPTA
jgi:catechol 2,3-dioxygenase-like lactoylglutathione lyase family enzyme